MEDENGYLKLYPIISIQELRKTGFTPKEMNPKAIKFLKYQSFFFQSVSKE
jgi:hypothetical protein